VHTVNNDLRNDNSLEWGYYLSQHYVDQTNKYIIYLTATYTQYTITHQSLK
jgi:hypothetical protein